MDNFHNPQIGINTLIKNFHIYKQFPTIDKKWALIKQKIEKIQSDSNPFHIIIRIQFPIQLVATRTILRAQGLIFNRFAFDPNGVTKHGLTYTELFQVRSNIYIYIYIYSIVKQ